MAFWSPEFWARDFGASASVPRRGGASASPYCPLRRRRDDRRRRFTRFVATRRPSRWRCPKSLVALGINPPIGDPDRIHSPLWMLPVEATTAVGPDGVLRRVP